MRLEAHEHAALSEYREFPVPSDLADYFFCFWTQGITGSGEYTHRVLPDACIDIVFINDDPPVVVGPWTDAFLVRFQAGAKIFGARLHPGRAPSVLGMPASELLNASAALSDVWGRNSTRFGLVLNPLQTLGARKSALVETLMRATRWAAPKDDVVAASIRWFARHPNGRVEELSRGVGISHRQLQRRFCAAVGYGPKVFQSVLRFQRVLYLGARPAVHISLAQLAADAGYADQAHMTREVRRFANCTPTVLLQSSGCTLRLSDLFKTDDSPPYYPSS